MKNNFIPAQGENIYNIHYFDTISSTNTVSWELIKKGEKLPLIVIAKQQTAGKGQWGKIWQSSPNGLYLSLALKLNISVENASHLTLFTAYGIAKILREYQIPVELKWLNDLILNKQKLGGIKIETKIEHNYITTAVIGVGINWQNEVPNQGINLQSFLQENNINSIQTLAQLTDIILAGLFFGYEKYLKEEIDPILSGYLTYLNSMGKSIKIEGNEGIITGVTKKGELKVRLFSQGATTEICLPNGTISIGYN
jgi:BirA family transcriptional regulator, biotin operon repressor / biotin---[acetyl-CoA-carboxylase] ligase